MDDLTQAWHSVPPVTRSILLALASATGLALAGIVPLQAIAYVLPNFSLHQILSHHHDSYIYPSPSYLSTTSIPFSMHWPYITRDLQLWRLVTSFCFVGQGIAVLFDLFLVHRTSVSLETDTYLGDSAKYAWVLLLISTALQVSPKRPVLSS